MVTRLDSWARSGERKHNVDERNESSCSQVLSILCCMQLTKACTAEMYCNQFICSSVYQFVFIGLIAGPMHRYTFHEFYRVIRMVVTCHLVYKTRVHATF